MDKTLSIKKMLMDEVIEFFKKPLIYVLIFCIFIQFKIYQTIPEYVITSDSHTYAEEYVESIFHGRVNAKRTPLYPYFIKLIAKIGGQENLYNNIVMIQKILFIITLILFYYSLEKITKNKIITSVLTIILGICPFVILWNIMILTEAISLFEIILLIFVTILYLQNPKKFTAIFIGIIVLGMIMTRPSYIYILPIYLLFWILRFIFNKNEKTILTGLTSCIIAGLIILGYCGLMKSQHGEFSITTISYINNVITVIDSNSYKKANNTNIIAEINEIKGDRKDEAICWAAFNAIKEKYSVDELKELTRSSIKNDSNYIKYIVNKTINLGMCNIGTAGYVNNKEGYETINYAYIGNLLLPINFAFVYIMLIIAIIYLVYNLIRNARIDWIIAFFTILILANLFTLIVGAPFESQRLFLSSIIPILLLIGYVISKGINNNENVKVIGKNKKGEYNG